MTIKRKHMGKAVVVFVQLLVLVSPLSASEDVTLESFLGFDGFFALDSWTPLTIILENRGPSLEGRLEVQVTSGSEYYRSVHDTLYTMDVSLPSNSKKRCSFTIHLNNFSRPLVIRFKQGDRLLQSESINLRTHYSLRPLVVAAGRHLSHHALSPMPEAVLPLAVRARFLPETLYGYEGVRLLIMDAGVIHALNERQFEAVTQWIETGGRLMVAGEMNLGYFSRDRLRALLPVAVTGFQQMDEIRSMTQFSGSPVIADAPFLALRTTLVEGQILVSEQGLPILAERPQGLGSILFLAVDYREPPFMGWPGITQFWETILAAAPNAGYHHQGLQDDLVVSAITETTGFRFPNFFLVLLFIVTYVILNRLIFNRAASKQQLPHKHPGPALLLLVAALCAGAYFTFSYRQHKSAVRYNGFLHLQLARGQQIAHGNYTIGLYALKASPVRFDLGQRFHPIRLVTAKKPGTSRRNRVQIHESESGQTIQTPMAAWSKQYFRMEAPLNFPLTGKAVQDGEDLVLEISNHSSHTILDSQIYYAGRLLPLGDISPDQLLRKKITPQAIRQARSAGAPHIQLEERTYPPGFPEQLYKSVKLELTEAMLQEIQRHYGDDRDRMCIFGWMGSEVWPVQSPEHPLPGDHTAFVEWEVAVTS